MNEMKHYIRQAFSENPFTFEYYLSGYYLVGECFIWQNKNGFRVLKHCFYNNYHQETGEYKLWDEDGTIREHFYIDKEGYRYLIGIPGNKKKFNLKDGYILVNGVYYKDMILGE